MNTHEERVEEDVEIAELLRQVGPRVDPSAEAASEVEAAVRAEWESVVAERKRRPGVVWKAAAAIAAIGIAVTATWQVMDPPGEPIALLERASGDIFVAGNGRDWSLLREGGAIAVGDSVRSDARAALSLDGALALRIDRGTVLRVNARDRISLELGAVYVDAPPGVANRELVIETHAGAVTHIGTQYQVRVTANDVDVSVREGRVMLESATGRNIADAGVRLSISTAGVVQRTSVSPLDTQWQWASEIAPSFAIEGQPLSQFLAWVSRETGRPLIYGSPAAEASAREVTLHGSVDGLTPQTALAAVLPTTPLRLNDANATAIEIEITPIEQPRTPRPTP